MSEERIQTIKDQIRSLVQRMIDNGWESDPEIVDLMSQVIRRSQTQINELRAQGQQPQGTEPEAPQEPEQPPAPPNPPPVPPPAQLPHYDARLLWILSGRNPEAFTSYLQTYPTPGTASLLNNPDALRDAIAHLSRIMPPGEHETLEANGIPHAPLQSSNIWGALYDQNSGRMRVRFQGGSEYEYDGIPANIFRAFISGNAAARTRGQNQYGVWWPNKNPSLGAAFNQYVREGGFNYRRIR
jgi:KTSC domain